MGHRAYSRHGNGRFRRATLENTFGLSAPSCPSCGRLNPHGVNEPPPDNCHACGAVMRPEGECAFCGEHITMLGGSWTMDDGQTACTDTSAAYVPHKPKED
jgi:hypothetical protein